MAFESLTDKLQNVFKNLRSKGRLTEADVRTAVYKYKGGKAKKVRQMASGHTAYYAYPGHAGVISVWGHMGYESVSTVVLKNGKLKSKSYGGREVKGSFFPLRQSLYSHIKLVSSHAYSFT